jgi:glycine cleavage system regulatory protein
MATLLDIDSKVWLLLRQFLDQPSPVSQCLSYFHADLSFRLPIAIEPSAIQDELLVLEKHCNL